jgi:hypothetical protein
MLPYVGGEQSKKPSLYLQRESSEEIGPFKIKKIIRFPDTQIRPEK